MAATKVRRSMVRALGVACAVGMAAPVGAIGLAGPERIDKLTAPMPSFSQAAQPGAAPDLSVSGAEVPVAAAPSEAAGWFPALTWLGGLSSVPESDPRMQWAAGLLALGLAVARREPRGA